MGDDGAGVRVAERLLGSIVDDPRVSVVTGGTAGMALLPHVTGSETVVFVDALDAGAALGAVFRFDPDEAGVTNTRSHTSHGVGIPYLITTARLMGTTPEFVVFAIQIGDTMLGPDRLSPAVESAVERVAEMVTAEVRERLVPPSSAHS